MSDTTKDQPTDVKPNSEADKKLLKRIRTRVPLMMEADEPNRKAAKADLRFLHVPGAQWDDALKTERGADRPCYEFDKLSIKVQRVVNEMRANRPSGKVRGTEDSDKPTADVFEGLCRNIDNVSDADTIMDYAGEYQVGAGMGAWRVCTDYEDGSVDQQCIRREAISNPFGLYPDPASRDPMHRDSEDWALVDDISRASYKLKYKNKRIVSFEGENNDLPSGWMDETIVRVCEYWYKEPYEQELWLMATGETIDADEEPPDAPGQTYREIVDPAHVVKKRTAQSHKIMMCIASGEAILEGPTEQAGRNHRFVLIYGKWVIIDGKPVWYGLTRKAKDAQRSYNVERTSITETVATAPTAKHWATAKQADGNLAAWGEAHKRNLPVNIYNADPQAPGPPIREQGPIVPPALMNLLAIADQELKDVTGVFNEEELRQDSSGVAIGRRQNQAGLVTFNFPDNMSKGVKRTWEIYIDLIPHIYDTERTVRILGKDLSEKFVKINSWEIDQKTGEKVPLNDLSRGKYDVTVTQGPSFTSQRQEAAEIYTQLAQANPQLFAVAGDLIMKAADLPYSEEIAERMKAMLPPQIQQHLSQDKPIPPEVQAVMNQANQAMQMVQQHGQLVEKAQAELEKNKSEVSMDEANLKVARAQFDADVAKSLANITMQEAALTLMQAKNEASGITANVESDREALSLDVKNAITDIQKSAADYLQQALGTLAQIHQSAQPQVIQAPMPPARPRVVAIHRKNGALIPQYEDQAAPAMNDSVHATS